jgi:3-oxoacyl-[acyl-carrier-protein] synthase-3
MLFAPNLSGNLPFRPQPDPPPYIYMNGQEVFKFAVNAMSARLREAFEQAGVGEEDIDWVLVHQANLRIIDYAKTKLKIPPDRFPVNIERYGNTSAASVAILLDELAESNTFHRGDLIALCAFGGGLTSAAAVLRWARD